MLRLTVTAMAINSHQYHDALAKVVKTFSYLLAC